MVCTLFRKKGDYKPREADVERRRPEYACGGGRRGSSSSSVQLDSIQFPFNFDFPVFSNLKRLQSSVPIIK